MLQNYFYKSSLSDKPVGEEILENLLTLDFILNASEFEALNLLAAGRFVRAKLMTIPEAINLTLPERTILFVVNACDPDDINTKMKELRAYRQAQLSAVKLDESMSISSSVKPLISPFWQSTEKESSFDDSQQERISP